MNSTERHLINLDYQIEVATNSLRQASEKYDRIHNDLSRLKLERARVKAEVKP